VASAGAYYALAGVVAFAYLGTAAAVIGGLASLAASSLLAKKPKTPDLSSFLQSAGAGRTQQVRQPISPHEIPYGQIKKSGPILFIHTANDDTGRANGYLYLIHALAGTQIKAIRDVYLNDDLSTDAKFTGFLRVNKHLGTTTQTADADLVSEIPSAWTTDHRGRGIAYTATRLKFDGTAYPSGIPNIAFIIDGVDTIYDPRTLATGFTNNAALCIANWLTSEYGQNLAWDRLDEDSVIEAANICDERVLVRQYTTTFTASASTDILTLAEGSRWLDWGDGVRVSVTAGSPAGTLPTGLSAGTTYYVIPILRNQIKLATSAANALAGTAINLTTDSVGALTLTYYDEARYKLNGSFTLDAEKGEVLDQLRSAMAGYVMPRGGKWFIHAGAAPTPSFELTLDDLAGGFQVEPKRSTRDSVNGMRGVFVNPDANWQPDDSPVIVPSVTYLAEDDGEDRYGDSRQSFVTSRRQMARLMMIDLRRNRQQMTWQGLCKFTALKITVLDVGTLTFSRYFTDKEFQVMEWGLDEQGINLTMLEHSDTIYDWTTADEPDETPRQSVVLPDPSDVGGAPGELRVQTTPTIVPPFISYPLEWDAVSSISVTGYQVHYSAIDADAWQNLGTFTVTETETSLPDPKDFRVRAYSGATPETGATSDWTYNLAPDEPGSPTLTGTIIDWTTGAGADDVQIFDDDDVLIATVSSALETYDTMGAGVAPYRIRSVNATGNISELVDVV
jgi:hypothetical protein